jgi:hypothetical protein
MTTFDTARRPRQYPSVLPLVALLAVVGYVGFLMWVMSTRPYETWAAALIAPILLAVSTPIIARITRDERPELFWILLGALALKLFAALLRYTVSVEAYDGRGDGFEYARQGVRLAESYWNLDFGADVGRSKFIGTGAMNVISGILTMVIGPTALGAFVVFSWLSYWGLVLFYRAFKVGVPEGDHRRYALLVLFLPSLLYWPSSLGKDAWMLLWLGCAALGAARLIMRQPRAYPVLAAGLVGTAMIRPHVTVLLCIGLVFAFVLRPAPEGQRLFGPLGKPVGVLLLVAVSLGFIAQAEDYFNVDDDNRGSTSGATEVFDEATRRSSQGGSSFEATEARSVTQIPQAVIAVLFRPFPWEAHNAQALIASAEGSFLLLLLFASRRRLRRLLVLARQRPYVTLVLIYSVLFAIAFSSLGNFGILTRQRVQLFPFFLTLLALPAVAPAIRRNRVRN